MSLGDIFSYPPSIPSVVVSSERELATMFPNFAYPDNAISHEKLGDEA
jgi:hypothetical protein